MFNLATPKRASLASQTAATSKEAATKAMTVNLKLQTKIPRNGPGHSPSLSYGSVISMSNSSKTGSAANHKKTAKATKAI